MSTLLQPVPALLSIILTMVLALPTAPARAAEHSFDELVIEAWSPLLPAHWLAASDQDSCPPLLRHEFRQLQTGKAQSLCQYQGQVLLIVNTASYCGYTGQYEGLEALYRRYKDRGLVVIGFPSNDFGAQEPGSNQQIAEFCRTTYGVQFPLYEKASVARLDANPLYAALARATGASPKWNFHKYVVDRQGKPLASFASGVEPQSRDVTLLIERLLAERPPLTKG